jgi:hypothetical protein
MIGPEELVERVKRENEEFRRLLEEHRALDRKVEEFSKRRFLTPEQEVERQRLKKEKLQKKDKLVAILREYQSLK